MLRALSLMACVLLAYSGSVFAATVERLSPQELGERSELVFIGTVISVDIALERSPTRIWTDVTFEVERTLKGSATSHTTLRQLGGTVSTEQGPLTQKVHGYPAFATGERVLMFLERTDTGVMVVTGLAQGKFKLTEGADPASVVATRSLKDIRYPRPVHPVRTLAGLPEAVGPLYLDQLLDQIAGRKPIARPIRLQFKTPTGLPTPRGANGGLR